MWTNAVIHRDYHINRDIHVRIFDNRIEVESPGLFPAHITAATIQQARSFSRNPLIVNNLREFPAPPNIDAGEGVRMMFSSMQAVGLYPPLYLSSPYLEQDAVMVTLLNEERPAVWEQVSDWIDRNGSISNRELRRIAGDRDAQSFKDAKEMGGRRHAGTGYEQGEAGNEVYESGWRLCTAIFSFIIRDDG
jgi:ATP-dependent DNA helicase RecG